MTGKEAEKAEIRDGKEQEQVKGAFHPEVAAGGSWEGRRTERRQEGPKGWPHRAVMKGAEVWRQCWGEWAGGRAGRRWLSANGSGERSLTDVGVAGDLAKDVRLSPRGFSHLL